MDQDSGLALRALQSRDAIDLLSDKWRISIIHLLRKGALRTGELRSAIEEISPKMLTQTWRGMERDGLGTRTVYPVAPPHVRYELTKMGLSVIRPIQSLCHWAKAHVAERDAARARFDLARRLSAENPGNASKRLSTSRRRHSTYVAKI
jgi:DNA-binding HxlR family transcriptional regulator